MKTLIRKIFSFSVSALIVSYASGSVLAQVQAQPVGRAQQAQPAHAHDGHNHAGHEHHAHGKEEIAFNLPQWKTMHFDDAAKAQQHAEMVKKLGCEVKQGQHAGHIDLTYRCIEWKSMIVETHALAEQWSQWLAGSGFDVSHAHPDPKYLEGNEVVEFRLVQWKVIHGMGTAEEKQFVELLSKLGCQVVVSEHAGHSDIKFRAPTWRGVHVAQHAEAEQLGAWLKKTGFDVAPHQH